MAARGIYFQWMMLPPDVPADVSADVSEDTAAAALRRLQPFVENFFDLFGVPPSRRPDILREATAELTLRRHETCQSAHGFLLRRIIRRCAVVEEEILSGGERLPDELLFRDPPEFPEPEEG